MTVADPDLNPLEECSRASVVSTSRSRRAVSTGGDDSGGHATGDRGHSAARALQRVGDGHRVPGDAALAAGVRGRARLQAGLHHMVQGGRLLRVDQGSRHAFWSYLGESHSTLIRCLLSHSPQNF